MRSKTKLKRVTNSKLTLQASESGLIKRFGENVSYFVLGRDMAQYNLPFLHIVFQEMVSHFYVFGSEMVVLSQSKGIREHSSPKSLNVYAIHWSWE